MTFNPGSSPFRIRFQVSNIGTTFTGPYQLYVSKNGGAYSAVTATGTQGVQSSTAASSSADNTVINIPRL